MSFAARRSAAALLLLSLVGAGGVLGCSKQQPDLTGIWKATCTDYFGVQIRRDTGNLYIVTFCGIPGCLPPGEWMPNSTIYGDPLYEVVSASELRIKRHDSGSFTYRKCDANPFWPTKPGY